VTARVHHAPRACEVCAQEYTPRIRTQVVCGSEPCLRARQKQRFDRWYASNATHHIERVHKRRTALRGPELDLTEGLLRDGAAGRFFVTPHALEQWRRRYEHTRPKPLDEAERARSLGELIREAEKAHRVKELHSGAVLWRSGKPRRARFIVDSAGHGRLPVLITVLPPFDV